MTKRTIIRAKESFASDSKVLVANPDTKLSVSGDVISKTSKTAIIVIRGQRLVFHFDTASKKYTYRSNGMTLVADFSINEMFR